MTVGGVLYFFIKSLWFESLNFLMTSHPSYNLQISKNINLVNSVKVTRRQVLVGILAA